jgi:serine phosphatase RsbU (regulator of sigma subunit)
LLTHEGKVVGVLQVLNKKDGIFTSYDETLMAALASHAAVSIDNAQLMEHFIQKERMRQALEIARDIQSSLLPRTSPSVPDFDIAGWTLPCDETGGDYFDFIPTESGGLGIAVGDVSGHGIGPALLMTSARAFLRALVKQGIEPHVILERMNALLVTDMTNGRFMTMFYGVLRPQEKTIFYSSAGHEPPLLVRPETKSSQEFETGGCPLGILEGAPYPPAQITVQPGDILALSTDGIQESMDVSHKKFGRDQLTQVIIEHHDLDAASIIRKVHHSVTDFCDTVPQRDDLTLVILKCLG